MPFFSRKEQVIPFRRIRRKKVKRKPGEVVFDTINIAFMVFIFFITLYPFWYIFVVSFNEGRDAARGGIYFIPRVFSLDNYTAVFQNGDLVNAFILTITKTLVGTTLHVFFTGIVAYTLSHKDLMFRKFYILFGTITMFFSGGLIPYFILIRNIGLYNNFWVFIFPAMFSFWNMIIMMTFFKELPSELSESAKIDGAGFVKTFVAIILPVSMPILATIALFSGVYQWNDFFTGVLFTTKKELMPIQTILYKIISESSAVTMLTHVNLPDVVAQRKITSESIKLATMVVSTVPIICVYPFLQKYFVKGIMIGSVKG